jgi:short-subunit dehydrogenase
MRIDLSGKTAIITGSTAGIGLATAKGLATAGAKVVVNGRTPEAVERAVKAVGTAAPGTEVAGFAADLGNAGGCNALAAKHPNCEILVISESMESRTSSRFPTVNGRAFSRSTSCQAYACRVPICRQ